MATTIRMRARRGLIPVEHWNRRLISDRRIPPGLSETVKATLWEKPGDHPAVIAAKPPQWLADCMEIVTVKDGKVALYKGRPPVDAPKVNGQPVPDGTRFQQLRPIAGFVRVEDKDGNVADHLVLPGFYIIENDSDGVVWALSPHHVRAWFEPIE